MFECGSVVFYKLSYLDVINLTIMKTYRNWLLLACLMGFTSLSVVAQVSFTSAKLKKMAEKMNLVSLDTLEASAFTAKYKFAGQRLHVTTNKYGQIDHIGYAMVNPQLRNPKLTPLINFVERYLLEYNLPAEISKERMLERDKVEYKVAPNIKPSDIGYNDGFAYKAESLKTYAVTWERNGKALLKLTFPMDVQLIMGCTAIEMEKDLTKKISEMPNTKIKLSEIDSKLLQGKSDHFITPDINNKLYVKGKGSNVQLIYKASEPLQSVNNFAITGSAPEMIGVNLTLDLYGYNKQEISITYPQLVRFLKAEGCEIYFGIKKHSKTMVEGTLFAVQKNLGYCHVFKLDIPKSIFKSKPEGKVAARMYPYVPQHNISNDFFK